jgi:hypothetical protein
VTPRIARIVSGGQTGADRAALDWAIEHDVPRGGYRPKGRLAEDGTIPDRYQLTELRTNRADRTPWTALSPRSTAAQRSAISRCGYIKWRKEPSVSAIPSIFPSV